jgi:class 3 adenylate cyclase
MTQEQARSFYTQHCAQQKRPALEPLRIEQQGNAWIFVEVEDGPIDAAKGVIVREDGSAFTFRGALGRVFHGTPQLGLPQSNELVLGATELGRYQVFDNGIAIWDGGTTFGFPLVESFSKGRHPCIVAFFDLRGFTSWSKPTETKPDDVQAAICSFEEAVHHGFPTDGQRWLKLFVKGTGDGVMIVSQADWYHGGNPNKKMSQFQSGHARDFLHACSEVLLVGKEKLKTLPLAIGCAIAAGDLDRIFLFGRLDYIGSVANEAAKLQQHAWNEICITDIFQEMLLGDGEMLHGATELPPKRWRLRIKNGLGEPTLAKPLC